MKLKVVIRPEEDGGFSVAIPALPGCFSEGETEAEALANVQDAARAWLETGNDNDPFEEGPNVNGHKIAVKQTTSKIIEIEL